MNTNYKHSVWLFLLPSFLVIVLCLLFEPSWMTNDDAAMSMIAHGYGSIAKASPKLIFSNVLWGNFIQLLPTLGGLYGYSLATLLIVVISGMCCIATLTTNLQSNLTTTALLFLVTIQATLFPQFTVTAGLITVAGILMLLQYSSQQKPGWLALACACIFIGYLIRRPEMILICAVALPLITWKPLLAQRRFVVMSGVTAIAILGATIIDKNAYDGTEWQRYQTLIPSVLPLVAFDAMPEILAQPKLLSKHGYSENDIRLLERWMWFDTDLASPERLNSLTASLGESKKLPFLGSVRIVDDWPASIGESFTALSQKDILFLLLCSVLIFFLMPSKRLLFAWLMFFLALIFMGAIGRPGELRVYIPVIFLLILAPMASIRKATQPQYAPFFLALFLFVGLHSAQLIATSIDRQKNSQKIRQRLATLPNDEIIAGYYSTVKANHIFSVTGAAKFGSRLNNLYLFGWPAITPYSIAYIADSNNFGFEDRFKSQNGIWVLINKLNLLETYCTERNSTFRQLIKASDQTGGAKKVSCVTNE